MEKKSQNPEAQSRNFPGSGPATRDVLQARAIELAFINGRAAHEITSDDWAQAKRELGGEPVVEDKQAVLEAAPESERWDPVPGSPGHQAPESPNEDEDAEGRNESAQLVDEGINEAERDQAAQAARDAGRQDRTEK